MKMYTNYLHKIMISAAAVAALTASTSAFAGGFITDVLQAGGFIDQNQARVLDGWHHDLGCPLENGCADGRGSFTSAQAPAPAPVQMAYGAYCATPAGVFGPGPVNPVG